MILIDAGPLTAAIDRGDPEHQRCAEALRRLPKPLTTTWPAFTEAMHLLGDAAGWRARSALSELVSCGVLVLHDLDGDMIKRMVELMGKYQDLPMDLADASLVALAEARGVSQIVTLDSDFRVYRLNGRKAFRIVP